MVDRVKRLAVHMNLDLKSWSSKIQLSCSMIPDGVSEEEYWEETVKDSMYDSDWWSYTNCEWECFEQNFPVLEEVWIVF